MKYLTEYRDGQRARKLAEEISRLVTKPWAIMEVCGGQTHSIIRNGIDQILPDPGQVEHVSDDFLSARIAIGLAVDDTIHFIEAAQRARRQTGADASQAVLTAMQQAGPGIVITSVVLAAGFACLAFSGFQINAWMGLMTAIVICVALVFDFLF